MLCDVIPQYYINIPAGWLLLLSWEHQIPVTVYSKQEYKLYVAYMHVHM